MTPEELLNLNPEAFKSIVNNDIRGATDDETAASLRGTEVCRRWYDCLVSTKRSIETQFATFKIEKAMKLATSSRDGKEDEFYNYMTQKNGWLTSAIKFKASVEESIAEAKGYLRQHYVEADRLREAIAAHRDACIKHPDLAEEWDSILWQTLS